MKFSLIRVAINVVFCVCLVGCASIFSGTSKKITINSTPAGAKITIYDNTGKVVSTGQTPTVVRLRRGESYFEDHQYRVVIEKPGFRRSEVQIRSSLNGWYFGNILLGGVIGMVVVDPMTGAMYTLSPDHIEKTLTPAQRSSLKRGPGLGIMLKEQLSPEQVRHLKILAAGS